MWCVRSYELQEHYKKLKVTGGEAATEDMVDMVLQEMARFCEAELAPLNEVGDREGCTYVRKLLCLPLLPVHGLPCPQSCR